MGDEQIHIIQIKGEAYRFRPIPSEDYERIALATSMSMSHNKTFKVLTRVLAASALDDGWDKLTDLWVEGKLTHTELTTDILNKLIERQKTAEKKRPAVKRAAKATSSAK